MLPYKDFLRSQPQMPVIVAHRGAWRFGPENTIPGLLAAADLGCELGEIDVQVSADGELFLLHDKTLARMAGHDGIAREMPIADIVGRRLRHAWGGESEAFSDVTLPRFDDVLDAVRGKLYLDVDVKYAADLPATAAAIAAAGMTGQASIKMPVQTKDDVARLRALEEAHGLHIMPITRVSEADADNLIALLASFDARICEISFDTLETLAKRREAFERAGILLWANTLDVAHSCHYNDTNALADADAIWGTLLDAGVSVIQTDLPERLVEWRRARMRAAAE
jgi:glycerophosphoryl diester phosphodiesterase